jgi:cullin 4
MTLPMRSARGTLPQVFTNELAPLITKSITIILNREMDPSSAPGSYEQLYEACNIMVSLKQESEELYRAVEKSLKLCAGRILDDLYRRNETGMAWLALFMKGWEWYENRLVILPLSLSRSHLSSILFS